MKKNKVLNIVGLVIKGGIAIVIIAFVLSVFIQRFSDNELSFMSYRMFSVLTGSMIPKYNPGDILISKEVDPEDIEVGDAISYLGKEGTFKDKVVTHDVIGIIEKDGHFSFRAKGVANEEEDPIVDESQVYGKVVHKSVLLTTMYGVISTTTGMFFLIVVPLFVIIAYEFISRMLEKETKRRTNFKNDDDF